MRCLSVLLLILTTANCFPGTTLSQEFPEIKRRLPPEGKSLGDADRTRLLAEIERSEKLLMPFREHPRHDDARVMIKAVKFAIEHNEFYKDGDIKKARAILDAAAGRIKSLQDSKTPWTSKRGRLVLGYRSEVDDSLQPYGMEIPETLDLTRPQPLYVWLHGRGDSVTDMHFIDQRMNRGGKISVDDALVVHPFGRQCVGFKHAGEVDVLDVIEQVASRYKVDRRRIVLIGFSMGGAGVWHIGAHYADKFAAVSPGAGFAETKQYQSITPDKYPATWEQTLWHVYDVPSYVRNLFGTRVIAYSGEKDKQIQAARVMEAAFESEGHVLDHRIGPGMGHKYHPDTLAGILRDIGSTLTKTPDPMRPLHLQTRTLRYNQLRWVKLTGLKAHYEDTRVDAKVVDDSWRIETRNVRSMEIEPPGSSASIHIDGQNIILPTARPAMLNLDVQGQWNLSDRLPERIAKTPGLQGPIDDIFKRPFLVVLPSKEGYHTAPNRWVRSEALHFVERWKALMRGMPRVKRDDEVTAEDIRDFDLVLWGDPQSNSILKRTLASRDRVTMPLEWDAKTITLAGKVASSAEHVPVLIYPNPLNPNRYVAINAGLTFREDQDRTNSLQNPRLPDWAMIGLGRAPDAKEPGETVAAGFFGESW